METLVCPKCGGEIRVTKLPCICGKVISDAYCYKCEAQYSVCPRCGALNPAFSGYDENCERCGGELHGGCLTI